MQVTEQQIIDLESSISTLSQQKGKLIYDKKELELKNSELKSQVRTGGRMHDVKYKRICDEQNLLRSDILKLERSISDLSNEIMKKSDLKNQLTAEFKKQQKSDLKSKLIEIRDFYINFASDKTRVASMRAMSAEFAEKVEVLIKLT